MIEHDFHCPPFSVLAGGLCEGVVRGCILWFIRGFLISGPRISYQGPATIPADESDLSLSILLPIIAYTVNVTFFVIVL